MKSKHESFLKIKRILFTGLVDSEVRQTSTPGCTAACCSSEFCSQTANSQNLCLKIQNISRKSLI